MPPLPSTLTTWKLPTVRPISSSSGSTDERSSPSSGQWRISSSYWVWQSGQVRDTKSPQVGGRIVDAPAEAAVKRSKDQPDCGRAGDYLRASRMSTTPSLDLGARSFLCLFSGRGFLSGIDTTAEVATGAGLSTACTVWG